MGLLFPFPDKGFRPWLPKHLAARELEIERRTLNRYIRDGCPTRGGSVRVDDVLAWLDERRETANG